MSDQRSPAQQRVDAAPGETRRANRFTWPQIIVYIALTACAGNQILAQAQPHQDSSAAVIRARIEALLGGYEHSPSPEQWRNLGSAATPILAAIASDQNALPTRRARSLEGLASLGGGNSTAMFENLAFADQEPLLVRMSAVRGLGRLLPESQRISALRPLLKATHAQLRGVVAEVLAQSPAGCAAIREQTGQETEAWRSRFARGCADSGLSPGRGAIAPRDSSQTVATLASAGTSGGPGQFIIPLGTFPVHTTTLTPIAVNLPAGAISFEFVGVGADPTARVVAFRIVDPDGSVIFDYFCQFPVFGCTNIAKILPAPLAGSFSVLLPNSPTLTFKPGQWTFYILGAKETTANVNVVFKTSPAPTIDANLFFVGVPNLSAKSAPTDPNFQQVLSEMRSIYSQVGVTIGNLTYIDITGPDATRFADVMESDLGSLFQLSGDKNARAGAVNIFLVHSIVGGFGGFIILGESGGIPATPVRGATSSGLVVTMADFPGAPDEIGQTVAHETGHWLGLFHTTEINGLAFDPLPDTPECPQNPYDTDHDGIMQPQECVNLDATNLMFWTSTPSIPITLLTPDQGFVILRNPVQNADFAKLPPPPPPPPPPPATILVPQNFPTIQLAVDSANPGDTIQVGPGRWCGALISIPLNLVGQGATIMGCPPGPFGPVGNLFKRGFFVSDTAPGTSINGFVFDGAGFSETNRSPLAFGVQSQANGVIVDSNTFLGTGFGVLVSGNNCQVTHNVFDGFTVLLSNGFGGAAILDLDGGTGRLTGNVIQHNTITSTVPPGNYSSVSWISEVDVPLAGIALSGQDGTIISYNKTSITSNANGDAGVGILASDFTGSTTINLAITDNDGRGSQYGLIVTNDQSGGTGNSVGLTLRGNFGVNLINGSTSNVRNRSISTFVQCDPTTGVCP